MERRQSSRGIRGLIVFSAATALVGLMFCGCSHLTSDVGQRLPSKPAEIKIGESRLADVLKTVGPPSKISPTAGGFAMLYEYNGVDEKQLGFNVDAPILVWFKIVGAKSWLDHEAWLMTFDSNATLQAWGEERWRTVLGKGGGVQILVTLASLVDSTQIRRPAAQHDWGKGWLMPLPRLLNSPYNPDTGAVGLEQTLAPTVIGQRALEMTPPPRKFPKKK